MGEEDAAYANNLEMTHLNLLSCNGTTLDVQVGRSQIFAMERTLVLNKETGSERFIMTCYKVHDS